MYREGMPLKVTTTQSAASFYRSLPARNRAWAGTLPTHKLENIAVAFAMAANANRGHEGIARQIVRMASRALTRELRKRTCG